MWSTGRHARRAGLTIVELIVVTIIVAVLATMTVPRLSGSMRTAALRESALELASVARYARDVAACQSRACRLTFDPDGRRYALSLQADPQHDPGRFEPLAGGPGKARTLPDGVQFAQLRVEPRPRLDGTPESEGCVTFYADGQADAAAAQITDGRRTFTLLIAPAGGQARLVDEAVDRPPTDRKDLDE